MEQTTFWSVLDKLLAKFNISEEEIIDIHLDIKNAVEIKSLTSLLENLDDKLKAQIKLDVKQLTKPELIDYLKTKLLKTYTHDEIDKHFQINFVTFMKKYLDKMLEKLPASEKAHFLEMIAKALV